METAVFRNFQNLLTYTSEKELTRIQVIVILQRKDTSVNQCLILTKIRH